MIYLHLKLKINEKELKTTDNNVYIVELYAISKHFKIVYSFSYKKLQLKEILLCNVTLKQLMTFNTYL